MVKRRTDKESDEEGRDASDSTDPSDDDAAIDEAPDSSDEKPSKKTREKKRAVAEPEGAAGDAADGDADEDAASESEDEESDEMELASRAMTEAGGDGDDGEEDDDSDEDDEEDEELVLAAHQMGIQKYVLAAYFAAGMLGAYILGRFLHSLWVYLAIRDWFSQAVPDLAAIPDDTKLTYATVFSGVVALFTVIRCYKSDGIRGWVNDVAGELAKVKWPSKKETTNSTITVIATAAVAMTYLALLDRLWGFVTNLVYGTGA